MRACKGLTLLSARAVLFPLRAPSSARDSAVCEDGALNSSARAEGGGGELHGPLRRLEQACRAQELAQLAQPVIA